MQTSDIEIEKLKAAYQARNVYGAGLDKPIAAVTSNTVPWELLSAAGYEPVLLSPFRGPITSPDTYLEEGFDGRIRAIFHEVLSGRCHSLDRVIIPRTSEQEHKLFLYLSEVARQEPQRKLPQVQLYNLLHTRSDESQGFGLARTRDLLKTLGGASEDLLFKAIVESNAARTAIRSLLKLRGSKLYGAEAIVLIGAFYFTDRASYANLASVVAENINTRPAVSMPSVLIKGSMLDHPYLHRAIEQHGVMVCAEDDWWGSRAAGNDVGLDGDLVESIFTKYYEDTPSPRVFPTNLADSWFFSQAPNADGTIFYLSPEDDVDGWSYPRYRQGMDERGIPHLLIREDASSGEVSNKCHDQIEEFVASLGR